MPRLKVFLAVIMFAVPVVSWAQSADTSSSSSLDTPSSSSRLLSSAELDSLVAPIALYPDNLLAEVLIAATYPLEVAQAARWADETNKLKGEELKKAVDEKTWDDSVKALVAAPSVLLMMSDELEWTQKLGDAVLAQQQDVMDAIQRMRAKAEANNKLSSTKEQKVIVRGGGNQQVIAIESTDPETLYVPYYNPGVVYGDWPYPEYPPYYFEPPSYIPGALLGTGIAFGAAYGLARWTWGGNYWGGGVHWRDRNISMTRPININDPGRNWQHNPAHRQGVKYSHPGVQQKFGSQNLRGEGQSRGDRDRANRSGTTTGRDTSGPRGDRDGAQGQRDGAQGQRDRAQGQAVKQQRGGQDRGSQERGAKATQDGAAGKATQDRRTEAGKKASSKGTGAARTGKETGSERAGKGTGQARAAKGTGAKGTGQARTSSAQRSNIQSGRSAHVPQQGGRGGMASAPRSGGAAMRGSGGGGMRAAGGGGGGMRAAGGGGGGRGGGGRRSDIELKHDIVLLGRLENGLGFYRFSYNGGQKSYVGVLAQEVQAVAPNAVTRDRDGYLRVRYNKLGLTLDSYQHWIASGARIPSGLSNPRDE